MNLRQALLANILAAPEDDGPRLVYADWLEEFGDTDSDRARAEFIRLQCAAERLEEWSLERLDLEERAEDLLQEHGESWQQEVPGWVARGGHYRRGFIERAHALYDQFLLSAEELFVAAPVREVQLNPIRDGGRALAECPHLARLRRLTMVFEESLVDLPVFLASPYLAELTGLILDHVWMTWSSPPRPPSEMFGDVGATLLADCPRLSRLAALGVRGNNVGPEGLAALIASPHLARIEELDLIDNSIGDAGLERLARSPWADQLTCLDLRSSEVGGAGLRALVAARPARLRRLKVGGGRTGGAGIGALANCTHLTSLRELDVIGRPLGPTQVRSLARSPHLSGLRVLHGMDTGFVDDHARELAASPHFRHLHFVNLFYNNIRAEGALALARSPVLASITALQLGHNPNIGDEGIAALASSEFVAQLRRFDLNTTGCGPAAAWAIARSPHLSKLRHLNLQKNPIGDEGGRALCASPYLRQLRSLSVHTCGMGRKIKKALHERFGEALNNF
jgi:uncharacterized protein (TIGR02996 family)